MRFFTPAIAAIAFAVTTAATAAFADGTPRDNDGYSGGSSAFNTAAMLVKTGKYQEAISRLQALSLDEPDNPDVFNLLGFSLRKTGSLDDAGFAYRRALELAPTHKGALEYQGELFLMQGDVARAEANLDRLDELCFFGCSEERNLEAAIKDWRAKNGA